MPSERPALRSARLAAVGLLALVTACSGGSGGSPPSPAASAAGPWHQVFADEFTGDSLGSGRWTTCYDWNLGGCTNSGNNEQQWYLPSQVTVGKGALTLSAERRNTQGTDGRSYPWTSGMVSTGRDSWDAAPRHTFTYGYFAAAVRFPAQSGMFGAFWLMPDTRATPPEVDVAEEIASSQAIQLTLHWPGPGGQDLSQATRYGPIDLPDGYHEFAVDREPAAVTWYVDGVRRFQVTDPAKIPHVPMEVLLTLAVGYPSAPPAGVDSGRMLVDWVRVWQH